MKSFIFRNIDESEHTVKYKVFTSHKKRGRETVGSHDVVFYTEINDDETLRHIEDVAEFVAETEKLPYTNIRFFEIQGDVMEEIRLSWDQKRYRGAIRIEESYLKKEEEKNEWQLLKQKFMN